MKHFTLESKSWVYCFFLSVLIIFSSVSASAAVTYCSSSAFGYGSSADGGGSATKAGAEFGGWYNNSGLSGSAVTEIATTATGDKEYRAKWVTCPATNSGEAIYRFVVKSSMTSGNVCAAANTDYPMTTSNSLSELIGGTLTARVSNTNRLLYSSGAFTYRNGDGGVLRVDLDCPIASGDIIRFINSAASSGNNAYVRHTSGSTSANQIILTENSPTITSVSIPDAFIGQTTLYIVRGANNNALISYFEIIRSCPIILDANTNGGKVGGENSKTLRAAIGDEISLPHAFKDGEKFKGWFESPSGGTAVSNPYTIAGPTTLYAQYEDCPDDGTLYKFEVGTGLTNGRVTANNVDFEFTTANYLTALIGGTLMTGGSKASYVEITNSKEITLKDDGAYLKVDLDCAIEEGDYIKSTISSNTIWCSNTSTRTNTIVLSKGTSLTPIPSEFIGKKIIYLWRSGGNTSISYFEIVRPYSVTYKPNGASGYEVVHHTTNIEKCMFTREDYKFIGWNTSADGSGDTYYPGDEVSEPITLYAQWEEIILTTITLDASDASNSYTSSVVATHNEAMPKIPVLPIRVGYVFDGYYDAAGGAGTKYYSGLGNSLRKWDKTDPTCTLYANWKTPCDIEPTLTNIMPIVTIWDQKDVEIGIVKLHCDFDISGITYSLQSVSPADPIDGCHFEYFDEKIHLIGKPNLNNASPVTVNVTFTIRNSCSTASTYNITTPIRIYPKDHKAKVAFIVTGTEKSSIAAGGNFNAYTADDKTACNDLLTYLSGHYDVTCVNGYATKDTTEIANYYKDYDLLVVTDFLNTSKGYTNAIGTLIDKKPILSFEAYVANLSNWHIQSNPTDPSPKAKRMYVLCNGHAIFKKEGSVDIVDDKDSVTVLSALSTAGSAKGLQGFVINEAPDFLFIATVKDAANNRDLVVCCERQKVFPARLMLFGVNFYEMANLSDAGRIIIRQMMDYLLLTDEKEVSDCSLVFDNGDGNSSGGGDGKWNNPQNWWPTYSRVPSPFQPTRIIRPCIVDYAEAHAGSVKINVGEDRSHNPYTGKITIAPTGGLTVAGAINKVKDTRWATLLETDETDIEIRADENHNGALVFGNKETNVRATVQYYSLGSNAQTPNPVWQYMGIPFQSEKTAIQMYHYAWMCRWANGSTDGLGGLWQWVQNDDVLLPFEGYCITQAAAKKYTLAGNLNEPKERTLALDNRDTEGFAFAANSWTAPIKISQMQDDDFTNAEKSIYIYHTGTYEQWNDKKDEIINTKTSSTAVLAGQYAVIPIHASPYIGVDSVIPAMQGFFVKTDPSKEASLKLVYNRVVYDSKYFKTSTQPMRAPSRTMELSDAPEVMVLTVVGDSLGADRVHILSRGDFSQSYEDGWDGRKVEGDAVAPKLSVVKDCGEMAVAAIETPEGQYLSFRAGEDSIYTFTFDYEGETIYLYDRLADEAAEIRTGNTYTFRATNKTAAERFLITATPPRTPTQVETIGAEPRSEKAEKIIHENKLMILYHGAVYDAQGARVTIGKEGAR